MFYPFRAGLGKPVLVRRVRGLQISLTYDFPRFVR